MTDLPPRYPSMAGILGLTGNTRGILGDLPAPRDDAVSRIADVLFEGSVIRDPLRRAAWKRTAGSISVLWCKDVYGWVLHRDAEPGSPFAWDADHIIPVSRGGTDDPWNLRALNCSSNRSDGDRR